jgi:hypothetical protein
MAAAQVTNWKEAAEASPGSRSSSPRDGLPAAPAPAPASAGPAGGDDASAVGAAAAAAAGGSLGEVIDEPTRRRLMLESPSVGVHSMPR